MCVMVLVSCRVKESRGWELVFTTPYLDKPPQKIAVNAKVIGNGLGDKMLAYSTGRCIYFTVSECSIRVYSFSCIPLHSMIKVIFIKFTSILDLTLQTHHRYTMDWKHAYCMAQNFSGTKLWRIAANKHFGR